MNEISMRLTTVSQGDGIVTAERLKELLSLGSEYDDLDFKLKWDPKDVDKNRFVKTLAAMSAMEKGGYVLVGVNDSGVPMGLDEEVVSNKLFDPANLGKIYNEYTGNSGIQSAVHSINGKLLAIIYVPRSPDFFSVMVKDASKYGGDKFLAGDVFVRENTSNRKLSKISANRIVEKIRQEERDRTIRVFVEHYLNLSDTRKPISLSEFISISSKSQYELLNNRNDFIEISKLGVSIANLIFDSDKTFDENNIRNSLSTVLSILLVKDEKSFESLMTHISNRYTNELNTSDYPGYRSARIALEIITIIEAVGSLAFRQKKFKALKRLTSVSVSIGNYTYASWLRHGQVIASREGVTKAAGNGKLVDAGMPVGSILISKAFEEIRDVLALRPEAQNELDYELMKESLLDSVISFDFLWCIITFEETGREKDYYPGWVFFDPKRVVDLVKYITSDYSERELIFKDPSIGNLHGLLIGILTDPERYVDYRDLEKEYDPHTIMEGYHAANMGRKAREAM